MEAVREDSHAPVRGTRGDGVSTVEEFSSSNVQK